MIPDIKCLSVQLLKLTHILLTRKVETVIQNWNNPLIKGAVYSIVLFMKEYTHTGTENNG